MNPVAIVTGATSGIGKAVAKSLAIKGYNLIITGRRTELLAECENELKKENVKVLSLPFDVRIESDVEKYLGNLPGEWRNIAVLVNNAGLAVGLDPIQNGVLDDWERMIDTNVKGLLYVTRVVSKIMIDNGNGGHIINLGSIAGKEVYPDGNVYCASKHAVDALTKGMRIDLLPYGIKVSQICPGAVETEFSKVRFKGDMVRADNVYKGFVPLRAQDIADAIMFMINCPAHVNINDMVIMPVAQASSMIFNKKL
ncbi:MAG: SDR family NAD(P)-dependent oxidoreductase [Bacteroidales bacterium]|nr:SDR family NAD(P)-dependent oxidoreductase [Bacteroidales bacterium]MDD4670612.1 SDR family NAD(P)-dependent oxidoreductase [Bacteroidales bacterium]